jgi:hypothetical protein
MELLAVGFVILLLAASVRATQLAAMPPSTAAHCRLESGNHHLPVSDCSVRRES